MDWSFTMVFLKSKFRLSFRYRFVLPISSFVFSFYFDIRLIGTRCSFLVWQILKSFTPTIDTDVNASPNECPGICVLFRVTFSDQSFVYFNIWTGQWHPYYLQKKKRRWKRLLWIRTLQWGIQLFCFPEWLIQRIWAYPYSVVTYQLELLFARI